MRLLIVEDDRESADYLVKAFREVGHVAELAGDGEEGLSLADGGDYDVLIIDRMLPKRDGLSVIGTLRDKGNRTPALILSALGQVDEWLNHPRASILQPTERHAAVLARLLVGAGRGGDLVTDAHLAAIAIEHGAELGTFDRDFALSLVSSEQEALSEIDAAIKRIHDGTYGICEITQKPIAKDRLLAVPFTRYSAEAQKELERNRHRARTQAGLFGELGEEGAKMEDDRGGGDE